MFVAKTQQNNHAQTERAKRKPLVVPTYSDEHQTEGSSENHSLSWLLLGESELSFSEISKAKTRLFRRKIIAMSMREYIIRHSFYGYEELLDALQQCKIEGILFFWTIHLPMKNIPDQSMRVFG